MNPFVESLEPRIAPATLVDAKTVSFIDADGDTVQVKLSKAVLTEDNWQDYFSFQDNGGGRETLLALDLSDSIFAKTSLSVSILDTVGNGSTTVGAILAGSNNLGKVDIAGALGKIEAGDSSKPATGVASLTVGALGVTNPDAYGLANVTSEIYGKLGKLSVTGDVTGTLLVLGGKKGGIGSIVIGGTLLAGGADISGRIFAEGDIGKVNVGGIDGRLADAADEASINTDGKIASLTVNGSVWAGTSDRTGSVFAKNAIGAVVIHGHLGHADGVISGEQSGMIFSETGKIASVSIDGNLAGGEGDFSGSIYAGASLGKVVIGGSLTGGDGEQSGYVYGADNIGGLQVKGSLSGGSGELSGSVVALNGKLTSLIVEGDQEGGSGDLSGTVFALKGIGSVTIGKGLTGGTGEDSGSIQTGPAQGFFEGPLAPFGPIPPDAKGNIGKVYVGEDVTGSSGLRSGAILAWNSNMGAVTVEGSVIGGAGTFSALIYGYNTFSSAFVGGDLIGGSGAYSGRIATDFSNLGAVTIGGKVEGGTGDSSATIYAGKNIGAVSIGESLIGGGSYEVVTQPINDDGVTGEKELLQITGHSSGSVQAKGNLKSVSIGGSLIGSHGDYSGSIRSGGSTGKITIGTPNVKGDVIGGGTAVILTTYTESTDENDNPIDVTTEQAATTGYGSGAIFADKGTKDISITGDLIGGQGTLSGAIFAGTTGTSAVTGHIGAVTIGGKIQGGGSLIILTKTTHSIEEEEGEDPRSVEVVAESGALTGEGSGYIFSNGNIKSLTLGGSLEGSHGRTSGAVITMGNLGPVVIGGQLKGGGVIETIETVKTVEGEDPVITESKIRSGDFSGYIEANGSLKKVDIGAVAQASLLGADGDSSGAIFSQGNAGPITLEGGIIGGDGAFSARISSNAGNLAAILIKGDLIGGKGANSANIFANQQIASVTIQGAMTGGDGDFSGSIGVMRPGASIIGSGSIGTVSVGTSSNPADVTGGKGLYSGAIVALTSIKQVTITGDLAGGEGSSSGAIESYGNLDNVSVGSILGGQNTNTGRVYAETTLKNISLSGSLIGGDYSYSGTIIGGSNLNSVNISGDVIGGNNAPGRDTTRTGAILGGKIGSVLIGGDLQSGERVDDEKSLTDSGVIRAAMTIGSVKILGSIVGNAEVPVLIAAQVLYGPINNNVTIGSVDVANDVSYALILAGVNLNSPAEWTNPFAQIKSVVVGGNWTASSISAGAAPGPDGYGDGDTTAPNKVAPSLPSGNYSKIGKIVIKGTVTGGADGDQYGFVSANFGTITIGSNSIPSPAPGETADVIPDGKVKIHRLPLNTD